MSNPDAPGGAEALGNAEPPGAASQLEPHAQALLSMLRLCTLSQRSARVGIADFVGFVKHYSGKYSLKYPQLSVFGQRTEGMVDTYLRMLEEHGLCSLEKEGPEVRAVVFLRYSLEAIQKAYAAIEAKPELPFPTEEDLRLNLPAQAVSEIDIKTDFVSALGELKGDKPGVLRLTSRSRSTAWW